MTPFVRDTLDICTLSKVYIETMQILSHNDIQQKVKRIAIHILENNYSEKEIFLVGINKNGYNFAKLLYDELSTYEKVKLHLVNLKLNPKSPLKEDITIDHDLPLMKNKVSIIIDDVANTGRTIFYAFKPFLEIMPKKLEVAVLVNRKHKSFPIKVDYVGMSLATTLKDNINVKIDNPKKLEAHLD